MPEAIAIGDFVKRIAIGAGDVFFRHHRPADNQLADFARRQLANLVHCRERPIVDGDDLPLDPREAPADAGSRAGRGFGCRFAEHFAGGNRSDR